MTPPALPRVVFVIVGLERGGSELQLITLLERLHRERVQATLVTVRQAVDPALRERVARAGIEILTLAPRSGPGLWRVAASASRMAAMLARRRPDAVYAWLEEAVLLTAPVARLTRTPLLIARRNVLGPYAARGPTVMRAIALAERQARVVTVNSRAVAEVTRARGVPTARIRLVPNGHALTPAPPPSPGGEVVLGYVARFRSEKGHRRLLDALARVRTDVPWRVDLAGDGPLQAEVKDEAGRRGLGQRIRFVGPISDPGAFWARRHVAVLLSDHEGSPNALIEAALAARPIVATAVGGIPDVVPPGAGRLLAPGDIDAIAAALTAFVDDPVLRRGAGEAARAHAVAHFAVERSVTGHWAAIEEALQ